MTDFPRMVISAPAAGSGKTAVTTGLLAALAARGLRTSSFAVGPDHVDSAYHALASSQPGRNLDPTLVGPELIGPLFAAGAQHADITLVEGAAGVYDEIGARVTTAYIAAVLQAPVLLVVNAAGQGRSAAAVVHGVRSFDPSLWLAGVVFTGVSSQSHAASLAAALEEINVPLLGMMYRSQAAPLPSHHHGIVPAGHGEPPAVHAIESAAAAVESELHLERIVAVARSAPALAASPWSARDALGVASDATGEHSTVLSPSLPQPVVALLAAGRMAFGYREFSELLEAAGARVELVDPFRDEELPSGVSALAVGGGLSERYAEELARNGGLRRSVAELAQRGAPIIAEGGGAWWLSSGFEEHDMCGVLEARASRGARASGGYRTAIAISDNAAGTVGTRVTGYVLRKWELEPRAGASPAWRWSGRPAEGFAQGNVYASFLEQNWCRIPQRARLFVARAAAAQQQLAREG